MRGRDTGRPVQLVITGAFAPENQLVHNQALFPDLDVWRLHLPDNHTPRLVSTSVGAFASAFSHALRQALGSRRATVLGLSTGAVVALALDADLIERLVLAEPLLRPSEAWPLRQLVAMTREAPRKADFVRQVFGFSPGGVEPRDYSVLLMQLRRPALVILGDVPLYPERDLAEWPSLVDDETRKALHAHPLVRVEVFAGAGHNVVVADPARFFGLLREATAAVPGRDPSDQRSHQTPSRSAPAQDSRRGS